MISRFERFSFAINEISRCWNKLAAEEMAKYGLKGPHAIYLEVMRRHEGGITAAQLCELCGRDKADVSRAVAIMEEKGLIMRECVNNHLYRAMLKLTEAGKRAADFVCERASMAVEVAGKDITDEERALFYRALESITNNLQNLTRNGIPQK